MSDPAPIPADAIIARCRALGFALAGVCRAEPSSFPREFHAWIEGGMHGEMGYLARDPQQRMDPARVMPGARSIILIADLYRARAAAPAGARVVGAVTPSDDTPQGRIGAYAQGDDYHLVIKKRLHALCDDLALRHPADQFRAFVDTAPILEREHGARAALGWIGKHTLLINPRLGSFMLLGGVLTTLDLSPPAHQTPLPDHCGTCTRCIDACPTSAITPYRVDASRCISYLTIEHRSLIDPALHAPMGDWVFGCDVCQDVCPHNSPRPEPRQADPAPHPAYAPRRAGFDLLALLGWTEEDRRAAFARSSMKRARLDMMRRNAAIAAGNAIARDPASDGARALRRRLEEIALDPAEPEPVRLTARQVLERLASLSAPGTPRTSSRPDPS